MENLLQDFSKTGKKLVEQNLVYSSLGNMSYKRGDKIFITATGAMLDELNRGNVIEVPLQGPSKVDKKASCELIVHREIYKKTNGKVIIHAHSPFAILLSLISDKDMIETQITEQKKIIGAIPIVEGESGSRKLATASAKALMEHKTCIIKDHGTITIENNMEKAYMNIAALEHICRINYYYKLYKKE